MQPKPSNKSLVNKFIHTINLASVHLRKKDESVTTFQEALKKKPKKSSAYIAIAPDPDQKKAGEYENYKKVIPLKKKKAKTTIDEQIKSKRDEVISVLDQVKKENQRLMTNTTNCSVNNSTLAGAVKQSIPVFGQKSSMQTNLMTMDNSSVASTW